MKYGRNIGISVLVAGLMLVSACGKATTTQAVSSASPGASADFTGNPDGPYCREALKWAVVEMTPRDGSVAGETKYWTDYEAFLKRSESVAPAEIKSDIHVYANNGINNVIPVIRKYGFDEKRYKSDATAAEKNVVEKNPPRFDEAFGKILAYEWQVCGNGTPDAAKNVKFSGDKDGAYCKFARETDEEFSKIRESGFNPSAVKAFTEKLLADGLTKAQQNAPDAIKSDVEANANWVRTKQVPVLAKYGYDFKKIKQQATADERFASDLSAVEIRDVERRLNAYDSQVCGL